MTHSKFPMGQILTTPSITDHIAEGLDIHDYLTRHGKLDLGDLCFEDNEANTRALEEGERILSSFVDPKFGKLWIITEADRSSTTILKPEEY